MHVPHTAVCPLRSTWSFSTSSFSFQPHDIPEKFKVVIPVLQTRTLRSEISSRVPQTHRWQVAEPGLNLRIRLPKPRSFHERLHRLSPLSRTEKPDRLGLTSW